ncbi:hypothetical protein CBFG_05972 [Clostridiales bacterium 1_7_47FAA]|nr:hypothetical protein CBFG_05972 [Clostridiales bacterium 1_7_47FAA]
MEQGNMKQFPLKICIFCVYNGEESDIPLHFCMEHVSKDKGNG